MSSAWKHKNKLPGSMKDGAISSPAKRLLASPCRM